MLINKQDLIDFKVDANPPKPYHDVVPVFRDN